MAEETGERVEEAIHKSEQVVCFSKFVSVF